MKKFLMSLCCLLLVCGCSKEVSEPENNETPKENNKQEVTIIDVNSNTRPYAVMINTHNDALPQSGLNDAYIVYELMVEGGITRMMALFKDVDLTKVGSVRSARVQYLDYVYENDAIYVSAGGAKEAIQQISKEGINHIDVDGIYGVRDTSLDRAWEHTLFTNSNLLNKAVTNKKINTTTTKSNLLNYSAEEIDLSKYSSAIKANDISIKYSNYRTSIYKYDENNKNYLRYLNSTANTDLVSKEQYTAKNIIAYALDYTTYTYNNYSGYQRIDNIGSGEGYYISNGYAVPITWEKTNKTSQTVYKIKETGEELVVNDGNTYIQIYPKKGNMTIN